MNAKCRMTAQKEEQPNVPLQNDYYLYETCAILAYLDIILCECSVYMEHYLSATKFNI